MRSGGSGANDPLAALAATMAPSVGRRCQSCVEPYGTIIRRWLTLMAEHPARPGAKHRELRDHLVAEHGYTASAAALQQHMQEHERELYARAKVR